MKLRVKVLDDNDTVRGELVIDVPSDITVKRLISVLKKKRSRLFDPEKEYGAYVEMPGDAPLGQGLYENALVTIKPKGWDWDVKIIEG